MRILRRSMLCLAAAFCLLLICCAAESPVRAEGYNAQVSMNYALAHYQDSKYNGYADGACNVFVSDCLKEGGINIIDGYSDYGRVDATRARLLPYGVEYPITFRGGSYCYAADNPNCALGDVVFFYCRICGNYAHTWMVASLDDSGRYHYAQVSPAIGPKDTNSVYWDYHHYDKSGAEHPFSQMTATVIHLTGAAPTYKAPEPEAAAAGTHVLVSWKDTGASSYYIYALNTETGETVGGKNIGRDLACEYEFSPGAYRIFVTAVYSENNMQTGETYVYCEPFAATLKTSSGQVIQTGQEGRFLPGENMTIQVNASGCDSLQFQIAHTPIGSDTYYIYFYKIYSKEELAQQPFPLTRCFDLPGYYSCGFYATLGEKTYSSAWIAWSVPQAKTTQTKNVEGVYSTYMAGEKIHLGIDALNVTWAEVKIRMTPLGSDTTVLFKDEIVDPHTFEIAFSEAGSYACSYTYTRGSETVTSLQTYWDVLALETKLDKGSLGVYEPGEPVRMELNTNVFQNAMLSIWYTPPGGVPGADHDSRQIFYDIVDPNHYAPSFDQEGYYSCGYYIVYPDASYASKWIAWYVTARVRLCYDLNGGEGEIAPQISRYNEQLLLSETQPTREGYDFLGWAASEDAVTAEYQPGQVFDRSEGDICLYAVWKAIEPDCVVPAAVTVIEKGAFQGCAFTYVRLSEATTAIEAEAFTDCSNLRHLYLPERLTFIGADAIPANVIIHGKAGSYAEFWAGRNGYAFIAE